ncbi:MAG: hypothetical protein FD180_295 [Planctomycetota bacterium]|nr:MAG: hypothetical protein FD180_295 [Planctomycetota bacterium]
MDGSFLSNAAVIDASKNFVCIRLATYESKEEAEVMKSYFVGASGELENTMFALLTPDAKKIGRAGRSPGAVYADAAAMAAGMKEVAAKYAPKQDGSWELPVMKNARLALDVAACEGLACVLLLAPDKDAATKQEESLAQAAWKESIAGKFIYATVTDPKELEIVKGVTKKSGTLVIEPDTYGVAGKVLLEMDAKSTPKELEAGLLKGSLIHKPVEKDPGAHIREGRRLGIDWKTEIPDTDPGPGGKGPR